MNDDNNLESSKALNIAKIIGFVFGILFFLPIFLYLILYISSKFIFDNNMNLNEMIMTIEIVITILIAFLILICAYRKFRILRKIGKKIDLLNGILLVFAIVLLIIVLIKELLIPIKFIDYTNSEYIEIKGEKIPTFYSTTKSEDTYVSFRVATQNDKLGNVELVYIKYRYLLVGQKGFSEYKDLLHENGYVCLYSYINGKDNDGNIYTEYAHYNEETNQSIIIEISNNNISYTVIEGNYTDYDIYQIEEN